MSLSQKSVRQLYQAHAALELVLGGMKLRGTYKGVDMPLGTEKFVRHHGVSLLAIALLGFMVTRLFSYPMNPRINRESTANQPRINRESSTHEARQCLAKPPICQMPRHGGRLHIF